MSILPKESVKVLAEQAGIDNLADDVAAALVSDVEFRLREIVQEGIKFMRHGKRKKLTTADIDHALRLRNVELLYGYGGSNKSVTFRRAGNSGDLFFVDDKELSLNEIFAKPLPKCPHDITFFAHWLAIEGVQPITRHNPPPKEELVALGKKRKERPTIAKDIVKHHISSELQLYFEKVTAAVTEEEDGSELLDAALSSVAADPGIHQLVPYFVQFINDNVTNHIRDLRRLTRMMNLIHAMLQSPYIHLELYLHQLMPPILTCIVGRWLCSNTSEDHWSLRELSADLVAQICERFGHAYTNLQPRVTKTLLHAFLDPKKPLTTHFGAITALTKLGPNVVQVLILPNLAAYMKMLKLAIESKDDVHRSEANRCFDALLNSAGVYLRYAQETAAVASEASSDEQKSDAVQLLLPGAEQYYQLLTDLFGDRLIPFTSSSSSTVTDVLL